MGKKGKGKEPKVKPLSPRLEAALGKLKDDTASAADKQGACETIALMACGSDVVREDVVKAGALERLVALLGAHLVSDVGPELRRVVHRLRAAAA